MRRQPASFLTAATRPSHYPDHDLPEVAFVGRSNVGKSSLINALLGRRKLVRTSSRPGRTQEINFFTVGDCCFVDMPGYGYAKAPKAVRASLWPMVRTYLEQRASLCAVVLIVDIRRTPGDDERDLATSLADVGIPMILAVTKADKQARSKVKPRLSALEHALDLAAGTAVAVSATRREGMDALWAKIERLCLPGQGGDVRPDPGGAGAG